MKKVLVSLCALFMCVVLFSGCDTKVGYKEGTYKGSAIDNYGGEENTATAEIVIDAKGKIESVYLDTTYTANGVKTTKKALGDAYNMKTYNPSAVGEWYEQVEALEKAIVEKQGIDFLNLSEDGKTDAVSGCTIVIDALVEAVDNALKQAK